jgi:hypothetical protein
MLCMLHLFTSIGSLDTIVPSPINAVGAAEVATCTLTICMLPYGAQPAPSSHPYVKLISQY